MEIYHQYSDKNVFLDIWISRHFEVDGDVVGLEGQEVKWVTVANLKNYSFPEANQAIINKLLTEKNYC
jgi:8-oxo-dGTP diphosphatase